jgi:signal transduction histidine kinase
MSSRRWRPPRHGRFDVPLALGLAIIQIVGTHFASHRQIPRRPLDLAGYLLLLAGPAALVVRHRWPEAVLLVAFVVTLAYVQLGYPKGPVFLSLVVAFFTAAIQGRRRVAWGVLAFGYVSFLWLGALLGTEPGPTLGEALGLAAWLLLLAAVAEFVRARRERDAEAWRIREEQDRRRASEERLAMAREIHDVLAHSLSLINVQAGVALHLIDERPEQARSALSAIKDASRDALRELRGVLGVLRRVDEDPPRSPAPSVARLDELVSGARAAGLRVQTSVEGTLRPLPLGVDLAAYRIVQESLTNVTRHARASAASVRVAYGDEELTVEVTDDGAGRPDPEGAGGTGVRGMRERAEALGGSLDAGPRAGGGYRVLARLPLDDSRSEEHR